MFFHGVAVASAASALALSSLVTSASAQDLNIGDSICVEGYIMDNFCIKRGTLLDNRKVKTLEGPEQHTYHCLLDVGVCIDSGYQVLIDPAKEGDNYCQGFRFDSEGNDAVYRFATNEGSARSCLHCTNKDDDAPRKGVRLTISGVVTALGDANTAANINVTSVAARNAGCGDGSAGYFKIPRSAAKCAPDTPGDTTSSTTEAVMTDEIDPTSSTAFPLELPMSQEISPNIFMEYGINVDGSAADMEEDTISVRVTFDIDVEDAWVGFAFSKNGTMFGSEAVIGFPGKVNPPSKVSLGWSVQYMETGSQTLINAGAERTNDGKTVLQFTKILKEPGEIEIFVDGQTVNNFLWAHGTGPELRYHGPNRGSFQLVLDGTQEVETDDATTPTPTSSTTDDATTSAPESSTTDDDTTSAPVTTTMTTDDATTSAPGSSTTKDATTSTTDELDPTASTLVVLELPMSHDITPDVVMEYGINVDDAVGVESDTISVRVTYNTKIADAWVGFAVSEEGGMVGSEAIIGFPGQGNPPRKYSLGGYSVAAVTAMRIENQTLINAGVEQTDDGKTMLQFTKLLRELGEIEIVTDGVTVNNFLWAHGNGPELAYHGDRGSFQLVLDGEEEAEEQDTTTSATESSITDNDTTSASATTTTDDATTSAPDSSNTNITTSAPESSNTDVTTSAPESSTTVDSTTSAPVSSTTDDASTSPASSTTTPPSDDLAIGGINCAADYQFSYELSLGVNLEFTVFYPEDGTGGVLRARLTYDGLGWVALGFSSDGRMVGSEAVIGIPGGVPQKYNLTGYAVNLVLPMADERQTLSNHDIKQVNGKTVLTFTKLLEEGEIEIVPDGSNYFLWAVGFGNNLGYHLSRGIFILDLETCLDDRLRELAQVGERGEQRSGFRTAVRGTATARDDANSSAQMGGDGDVGVVRRVRRGRE